MIWRIKFLDISKWQGEVDFVALRNLGYDYILLRCTSGATYRDEKFHEYYAKAKAAGFKVGAYFVINPLFSALAHWVNFSEHLGGRILDVVPTADVELTGGLSSTVIALRVRETLELFRTNYTTLAGGPIIYTAEWFWGQHIGNVEWALAYSLHVAQYPWLTPPAELPADRTPTVIPNPWRTANRNPVAWQWTDKGRLPTVTSASLDFNVGWDTMFRLVYGYLPGEEPPMNAEFERRLLAVEVLLSELKNSNTLFISRIGGVEGKLTVETNKITGLTARMGTAENRISIEAQNLLSLTSKVSTIEAKTNTHQTTLAAQVTKTTTLETALNALREYLKKTP